jgi:hypothetical protein
MGRKPHPLGPAGYAKDGYGTSRSYVLATLARYAPEFLDRYSKGEFRSARDALRAAGLLREKTPLRRALDAWAKLSDDDRKKFLRIEFGCTPEQFDEFLFAEREADETDPPAAQDGPRGTPSGEE